MYVVPTTFYLFTVSNNTHVFFPADRAFLSLFNVRSQPKNVFPYEFLSVTLNILTMTLTVEPAYQIGQRLFRWKVII